MFKRSSAYMFSAVLAATPSALLAQPVESSSPTAAQDKGTTVEDTTGDIIVTAQKREQRLNDVPMSITAATGDTLATRGVNDTADLGKIVAGFKATQSNAATPVYSLRGIGLYDSGVSSSPTVSVYVDEVPLAFPVMTQIASLDLERVEVLKGPQGTLFGQNATGGAINYVAAKPTSYFAAGLDLRYARFGRVDASGFVSGPLGDTLNARLAVRVRQGGAWQKSVTRPGDTLGAANQIQGRLLLDWQATERLKFTLNLSADRDNSEIQAGQVIDIDPVVPALLAPGFADSLVTTRNPRLADWDARFPNRKFDRFYQAALRSQYELSDSIDLVSITNYAHQRIKRITDQDGSAGFGTTVLPDGKISYVGQEVRLVGSGKPVQWILGASYDHAKIRDHLRYLVQTTNGQPLPFLPRWFEASTSADQTAENYAFFGNIDANLTDNIVLHAGARYTHSNRDGVSCTFDESPGQEVTNQFNALEQLFIALGAKTTPFVAIPPGGCITFTPAPDLSPSGPINLALREENVSWRAGVDYKTDGGSLLYANVSRGWKSGIISPIVSVITTAVIPAKQERLDAYEVGFKIPLADRKLQVNGSAFYYGYNNKQLRTRYLDPIFGLLERTENVPRSRVVGQEIEIVARPVPGFSINLSGTHLDAKITRDYNTYNAGGAFGNYRGSKLPYTPEWSVVADVQYEWALANGLKPMVGASMTHNSKTSTTFETASLGAPLYRLDPYTLFDLRAGIGSEDGSWSVQVFGRNITNKFYTIAAANNTDATYRMVGEPATYGVTLSLRTR